jgi:hypothetical protein
MNSNFGKNGMVSEMVNEICEKETWRDVKYLS